MKKIIYLQRIGDIDPAILIILKKELKGFFKKFGFKIVNLPNSLPLLDSEYNIDDRDYDAIKLKKRITKIVKNKGYYRVMGVLDVDIFSKKLKHIFGVADIPKSKTFGIGFISVTRLREELYGRAENMPLFKRRMIKEAIHELGHTFGLDHCTNDCVMKFSKAIDNADQKPSKFCEECANRMDIVIKSFD